MEKEYGMADIAPTACAVLGIRVPYHSSGKKIDEIALALSGARRVALVVLDGFGVSTWQRHRNLADCFNRLADENLLYVRSVLPAKTPVNFATMVTGAGPDVHKINVRTEQCAAETIFGVLKETGKQSAVLGWSRSTAGILLAPLADYRGVAESNTDAEVLSLGSNIIKNRSPEFVIAQLLDVDSTGHASGLLGEEMEDAVSSIDRSLKAVLECLRERDYGIMVTADHGAHQEDGKAKHDGCSDKDDVIVPLTWEKRN